MQKRLLRTEKGGVRDKKWRYSFSFVKGELVQCIEKVAMQGKKAGLVG